VLGGRLGDLAAWQGADGPGARGVLRDGRGSQFGYLTQDLVTKIARGNAIKLLGLDLP
jgi:hypothetical protein